MDSDIDMKSEEEENCQTSERGKPVRFCSQRESTRRLDTRGYPSRYQSTLITGERAPKGVLAERNANNREDSSRLVHSPNNLDGVETILGQGSSSLEVNGSGVVSSANFQAPPSEFRSMSPLAAAVSTDFQQSAEFVGKGVMEKKGADILPRESSRKRGRSPDLDLGPDQRNTKCTRLNDMEETIADVS